MPVTVSTTEDRQNVGKTKRSKGIFNHRSQIRILSYRPDKGSASEVSICGTHG